MEKDSLYLAELIEPDDLQQLQDRIAAAMGFSLILANPSAEYITTASNPLGFCRVMQDAPAGREVCHRVNTDMIRRARATGRPVKTICPHTGLITAAVPIYIRDRFLGIWMVGQVNLLDPGKGVRVDMDDVLPSPRFQQLLESVPTLWESGLDFSLDLLATTTSEFMVLFADEANAEERHRRLEQVSERTQSAMEAMRAFMDTANVLLYVTDYHTGEILMCNDIYARNCGRTVEEMVGRHCFEILGYKSFCPFCPRERLLGPDGELQPSYTWENYLSHSRLWLQCTNRASYWVDGRMVHVATCIDITQRKTLEAEVNKLAFLDKLLKIPNSVRLEQDLLQEGPFEYLLVVDIEGLRKINDVYGRACGDMLLEAVRDYMGELEVPGSVLYRLDVADFGLLIRPGLDPNLPGLIAEQVFCRCKRPWALPFDPSLPELYISVNVCVVPIASGDPLPTLYSAIEHTMEIARRIGDVALYDDVVEQRVYTRLKLELSLKNAVGEGMEGFSLVYQPIIDPGMAIWHGMEVLCRWNSPELGPIPPGDFIPVAESTGLIRTIGYWVLETALRQTKAWGLDQVEHFALEVNLSPIQLAIPDLATNIMALLEHHDYPPEKLCLEVTESSEVNFSGHNMQAIEQLHDIGVLIALDDFGTGYASFNTLHKLPVDLLKTERSFINGMETDPFLQRLFRVMVELAHGSNMRIVAEGVETDFQAKFLYQQGADLFQGYLYSEPLTPAQMEKELHRFRAVSSELVSMGYAKLDIAAMGDPVNYSFPPRLNSLLNRCMHALFWGNDPEQAIDLALSLIGQGLHVSRAYVFLRRWDGAFSNTHEWCAPGVTPRKPLYQGLNLEEMVPFWLEALERDGLIVASDVLAMENPLRDASDSGGVRALVEFPLWKDGELFGFVGVLETARTRGWIKEEIQMLHTLTGIIANTLAKQRLQNEVLHQAELTKNILAHMDTTVYVTELDTGRILFASEHLQKATGKRLVDDTCWEALHNRKERCDFCPVPRLLEKPGETHEWEFYNTERGRHFRIRDRLIPWENTQAHLEYAEDITQIKLYQSRLELFASTDTLTAALNRASFNSAVRDMLDAAHAQDTPVSLVFIDIDDLKRENDRYGHLAGDSLINKVVQELRNSIRESDLLGRYGGDEFVLAMMRCPADHAMRRMQEAQARLSGSSAARFSFSYGVVESTEIHFSREAEYLDQLVDLADRRMFAFKRKAKDSCEVMLPREWSSPNS